MRFGLLAVGSAPVALGWFVLTACGTSSPSVACGAGTHLEGAVCVADNSAQVEAGSDTSNGTLQTDASRVTDASGAADAGPNGSADAGFDALADAATDDSPQGDVHCPASRQRRPHKNITCGDTHCPLDAGVGVSLCCLDNARTRRTTACACRAFRTTIASVLRCNATTR